MCNINKSALGVPCKNQNQSGSASLYVITNRLSFGLGQPAERYCTVKKVKISKKQAHEIAKEIFADINAYIESHQAEYEAFLKDEGLFDQEGGEN